MQLNNKFDSFKTYKQHLRKGNSHFALSHASFECEMAAISQTKSDIDDNYKAGNYSFSDEEILIETYFDLLNDKRKKVDEIGPSFFLAVISGVFSSWLTSYLGSHFGSGISYFTSILFVTFFVTVIVFTVTCVILRGKTFDFVDPVVTYYTNYIVPYERLKIEKVFKEQFGYNIQTGVPCPKYPHRN